MAKRSVENTAKKQDMVKQLIKDHAGITMNEVGKRVRQHFGTQLAFPKLREAFMASGGTLGKQGRRKGSGGKPGMPNRKFGRRKSDRLAARLSRTLGGLPQHIVVVRGDDMPETHQFHTRDDAVIFTKKQLESGISPASIAYYQRQQIEVSIGI
jgi:hypothetical protein